MRNLKSTMKKKSARTKSEKLAFQQGKVATEKRLLGEIASAEAKCEAVKVFYSKIDNERSRAFAILLGNALQALMSNEPELLHSVEKQRQVIKAATTMAIMAQCAWRDYCETL